MVILFKHAFAFNGIIIGILSFEFIIFAGSNLPNSHFGYKHIRNMLENEPNQRPNLRELIQSLSSLKKMVLMDQKSSTRENEEQAIQVYLFNYLKR